MILYEVNQKILIILLINLLLMELFQNFIKNEQINFKLKIFSNSNHEKQMHEFFIKVIILIIHII